MLMKIALAFLAFQSALGFQPVAQPRTLTELNAYRYDPYRYMNDDMDRVGSRFDDGYRRGTRRYNNYYDSYGSARVPYDSFDAYSGSSGLRTLAPDEPGDVTGRSRAMNDRRNYGFRSYGGWNGYNSYNGYNNNYGYNNYGYSNYGYNSNGYSPYYERSSYAYASPVRAVRPDGTLGETPVRRYGDYNNRYSSYGRNGGYGRNLYVDEDRWPGTGRGLYSQDRGIETPFSRNPPRSTSSLARRGGYRGGYRGGRPVGVPIRGGDEETFTVEPNVSSVRVVLSTEGMPLYARMELLRGLGINNPKFLGEVFQDIDEGPFETIVETPDFESKLRIFNTGSFEYTIYAWLEPNTYGQPRRNYSSRNQYVSPYSSWQSASRFDENGRIRSRW